MRCSHAWKKSTARSSGWSSSRNVQLSGAASATATTFRSGRTLRMWATSSASCAFSVALPASGIRPKLSVFKRLPSASWKLTVPQDASRQHASSSPSGRSETITPSSETAQETASSGTVSASRMLSMASRPFSFQRLPVVSNRRVARRRVHAPQLLEEFGRFLRRAVVQEQKSAISGRVREIAAGPGRCRPARTTHLPSDIASGNTGPDRTACGRSSASAQPDRRLCRPCESGLPSRPGPRCICKSPSGTAQRPAYLTQARNRRTPRDPPPRTPP